MSFPIHDILKEAAAKHGTTVNEMCGPLKCWNIVAARCEASTRLRLECGLTISIVARLLKKTRHSVKHYSEPEWRVQRNAAVRARVRAARERRRSAA